MSRPANVPIALRILPPADRAEAMADAEARILSALGARFPDYDFTIAQSPRPPGAGLAVVPVESGLSIAEAEVGQILEALAALVR